MVIQLKRIGESNCKFYKTQSTENQTGSNNNESTVNKNKNGNNTEKMCVKKPGNENNNEIPLLLGSLIYDEDWFKSTIDNG